MDFYNIDDDLTSKAIDDYMNADPANDSVEYSEMRRLVLIYFIVNDYTSPNDEAALYCHKYFITKHTK